MKNNALKTCVCVVKRKNLLPLLMTSEHETRQRDFRYRDMRSKNLSLRNADPSKCRPANK